MAVSPSSAAPSSAAPSSAAPSSAAPSSAAPSSAAPSSESPPIDEPPYTSPSIAPPSFSPQSAPPPGSGTYNTENPTSPGTSTSSGTTNIVDNSVQSSSNANSTASSSSSGMSTGAIVGIVVGVILVVVGGIAIVFIGIQCCKKTEVASPCPACRVALLAVTSPCPARRVALPTVASPCPVSRVALLAVASPCCPRAALLPARRPALPALSRPAARTALLRAALLLAPPCCCPPCCAQPCWSAPCCPRAALLAAAPLPAPPCPRRPAAARPAFDTWLDALQLYLLSDSRDSILLFDHTSGASLTPPATAVSATRSQWLTHDGAARLAIRNHLPLAERAHFGQHKIAKALYDTVVARYSSPATAALGRLILPYLFPQLSAFATVEDLVLLVALLAHPSLRGVPPPPLPPPMLLLLLLTSLVLRMSGLLLLLEGKGGKSGGGGSGGGGGGGSEGSGGGGGGGNGGSSGRSGGFGGGGGGSGGGGGGSGGGSGSGGGGSGDDRGGAVQRGGSGGGQRHAEGDCYLCVPPDPGIKAAALGASESTLPRTPLAEALHTFTLDSGASRCFFRDSTTPTPLFAPITVRLANPPGGPFLARSSTVLLCPAVPSGSLSGLHLPSFSTNLVSTAALQDAMVTTTSPGSQRVSICTCTRTGRHLATFTHPPGSSLYTLTTEPPQVAASAQVSASGPIAVPCSCRLLSHQNLPWHHRLGHPSLPHLRGMHSCLLVSSLPRSLPPLPPSPALPCLPCIEGRQHAAPQSSSFPPTTAPLQTLHMVVKGEVPAVFIPWIRAVHLQLRERFHEDLPILRLHSDRGGELSSDLLRNFCRGEGILQLFTLPASPQQNGVGERRIGLVMEVARTFMIHAAAPHIMWPFATGKVGDASVFRVWGSRAFVRDTSADKLSSHAIPCVFLGFPPDAPGWQFYHPTSRHVLPSEDVTFDESVPFYRFFPYRTAPLPPLPLFLAPGPPPVDPLSPQGPAPSGVSQVDPLPGTVPVEVAVASGVARGAASGGATSGGTASGGAEPASAEPEGAEPVGAESEGVESGGVDPGGAEPKGIELEGAEPGGTESEGAESWGVEPRGTASAGGPAGASSRLSPRREPL
ncbi:unnamed protein product [Closterium sp. NIES-54]